MKKSASQFVPGLGVLLVAAVLLSVVGYFLHDFRGVQFQWAGAIIWLVALLISFTLGTIYLSRVLLPVPGNVGWTESFRLLWRAYFGGIGSAAGRFSRSRPDDADDNYDIPEVAPSFEYLGAGILPSHQAVAIVRGDSYIRAGGPGITFLRPGESIGQIFDLRPHICTQRVTANTRDGIPVDTAATVVFQVKRPPDDENVEDQHRDQWRLPYPYDRDAIFHLHYISSVAEADEIRPWTEQVCPRAATLLVAEFGKLTIDELSEGGGLDALERVKEEMHRELEEMFGERGIDIVTVGVGPLGLPNDVVEQRLATWQVGWESQINLEKAAGSAEAMRLMQQARARAQIEIIDNLVQSIESVREESDAELHEIVMTRLIELMESTVTDSKVQAMAPPPLVASLAPEASAEMRESLEQSDE